MLIRPIVANVDYLAIQFAAKHPNIDFERINLLLLTAFYYKVKPIVIVNKIDYLTEEELNELKEKLSFLEKISVPMFLISCQENKGLEEVEKFLNCSHVHEPGCNVKREVEENKISKDRYDFYKKTLEILSERWNRYD